MKKELVIGVVGVFLGAFIVLIANGYSPNSQTSSGYDFQAPKSFDKQGNPDVDPYIKGPVKNTIIKNFKAVKVCYMKFSEKTPDKSGMIKLDWQIGASGKPTKVEMVSSEFQDPEIEQCLISAVQGLAFPEPPRANYYIEHAFHFRPEGQELPKPELVPQGK